jgi:hypothetical protein
MSCVPQMEIWAVVNAAICAVVNVVTIEAIFYLLTAIYLTCNRSEFERRAKKVR